MIQLPFCQLNNTASSIHGKVVAVIAHCLYDVVVTALLAYPLDDKRSRLQRRHHCANKKSRC
jgi:hypothetical protein